MRNFLLSLLCLLCACNTPAQQAAIKNKQRHSMERFNISRFEQQKQGDEYTFTATDGRTVRQTEYPERGEFMEETSDPKTPYKSIKVYYRDGALKISGERFYLANINTWQYFSPAGAVEKQVNHEAPFRFSITDLIAKMKASYNIDIMRPENGADVQRDVDEGKPLYIVTFPVGPSGPGQVYIVGIDGVNGREVEKVVKTVKH